MLLTSKEMSQTQASAGHGTVILGPPYTGPCCSTISLDCFRLPATENRMSYTNIPDDLAKPTCHLSPVPGLAIFLCYV